MRLSRANAQGQPVWEARKNRLERVLRNTEERGQSEAASCAAEARLCVVFFSFVDSNFCLFVHSVSRAPATTSLLLGSLLPRHPRLASASAMQIVLVAWNRMQHSHI